MQLMGHFDSHTMYFNGLVTHFLQNTLFCVHQKKEIHTGLEQLEGE